MGQYHPPAIIKTFSPLWWETTLIVLVVIALIVWLPKYIKPLQHRVYGWAIGIIILINTVLENVYNYVNGYWNLQQNLPFHLCSISGILVLFYYLILNKEWQNACTIGVWQEEYNLY